MNNRRIHQAISARDARNSLGRLVAATAGNEKVVAELYLRTLSRGPSPGELKTCLDHIRATNNRGEAFEDIFWALLNSTEFLHRR